MGQYELASPRKIVGKINVYSIHLRKKKNQWATILRSVKAPLAAECHGNFI